MSGHTRRPWEYSRHKFPNPPFEGALEDEYGVYPPLGESGPVAITTGEDNARLISAAPDLLAALKDLRGYAYKRGDLIHQSSMDRCMCAKCIEARALVASAGLDG